MTRWTIKRNGIKEGQASSWHKALDVLQRQTKARALYVVPAGPGFVPVRIQNHDGTETNYTISKETIN
jgi:hypothetical protein